MDFILSWIRNIVIYLILISIVLAVIPSEKYKKYVQLFLGLVLAVLVARPLLKLIQQDSLLNEYFQFYPAVTNQIEELPELKEVEEQRNQAILDAYQAQIQEELSICANEKGWNIVELEIQWGKEENFGVIQQMQIYLEDREEEDFIVAPIVIEKGEAVHKQEDQMQQWKREIAKEYQVAEKCIIMKKK